MPVFGLEGCWRSRLFGLPSADDCPRGLQDGSTTAQEGFEMAQKASKWPRRDQLLFEIGSRGFLEGPEAA
eukprot:4177734-Pyramimonas_sp.AAC.1